MPRPLKPKTPSEHLSALTKMLRQVEIDATLGTSRPTIVGHVTDLIAVFQKLARRAPSKGSLVVLARAARAVKARAVKAPQTVRRRALG